MAHDAYEAIAAIRAKWPNARIEEIYPDPEDQAALDPLQRQTSCIAEIIEIVGDLSEVQAVLDKYGIQR